MYTVRYGGGRGPEVRLVERKDFLVVRTAGRGRTADAPLSRGARKALDAFEVVARFEAAGVEVLRAREARGAADARDFARRALRREPAVEFAGRALADPVSGRPVVYTENFFVKTRDGVSDGEALRLFERFLLRPKRRLDYAPGAWFVSAPRGTGREVFAIAERLLGEDAVELAHPELVRESRRRAAFREQWHLKRTVIAGKTVDAHANVEAAWDWSEGEGVTIAVIDDGVDLDHEEFRSPGKIVSPRDVTLRADDARPGTWDHHGTACAGVACADGRHGASGVAPRARLLPVRLVSGLGSQDEADAFAWAASHGADVISCSWGPVDGDWWNPADPTHRQRVPLPDSTRLAIDFAVEKGRGGKGCVVVFAAGNGNESVDDDGYASYERVMAVAATNDVGKRAAYSDRGKALWCAFPSSSGTPSLTPGIWTTDRSGRPGYNPGQSVRGDQDGNYTNSFGGTSSAAPGVAGVAALILARKPGLGWRDVREAIREGCDRVDPEGGAYDRSGHSRSYGYGRVNAERSVRLAAARSPRGRRRRPRRASRAR